MSTFSNVTFEDMGKLMIRIAVGGLILFHGFAKMVHGVAWIKGPLGAFGLPGFLAYGTYIAEVVAPILILLGVRARLAALVIAFDMVMAVLLVLRQNIFVVKQAGGGWGIELEAFFFLTSLALFFIGAGKYSVSKTSMWD
ncbi:MAG: DoxX family protein [Bacteroidota bacterium]|nr:DoxX family protein [Bacteroidota bacterium]